MRKKEQIQQRIDKLIEDKVLYGASYSFINIAKEEEYAYYRGVQGVIEPYHNRKIRQGMLYDMASLSKIIGTFVRVMQLIDEGKIDFDTKIKDILELFSYEDITIEQLLLHQSGLPAEVMKKEQLTKENIISYVYNTKREQEAGKECIYSDVGYILLGFIIEKLDQCSLEDSYYRHIFLPLKMNHTSFFVKKEEIEEGMVLPTEYTKKRGCICGEIHDSKAYLLGQSGSAGLFSTLEDCIIFIKAYLKEDERLFSKLLFDKIKEKNSFKRTYGWSKEYGDSILYHTGFTGTSMLLDVEKKEAFVLLTNCIHPTREKQRFMEAREQINKLWLSALEE